MHSKTGGLENRLRLGFRLLLVPQVLADGRALALHVLEHQQSEFLGRPSLEGVDDLLVLAHRIAKTVSMDQIRRISKAADDGIEVCKVCTEERIGGGVDNRLMDFLVDPKVVGQLATQVVRIHFEMQLLDCGNRLVRDASACQSPGDKIQSRQDLEQVSNIGL